MKQELLSKANLIKQFRKEFDKVDTEELRKKRHKFLNWLFNQDRTMRVLELYPTKEEVIKSKSQIPQYLHEYGNCNTRLKTNNETCLDIDKLPYDKMMFLICETIASLQRKNIHFAVFYAQGQRSPHVRIYDFLLHIGLSNDEVLHLNPQQKIKLQISFWRCHVPFGLFQYVDTGIFMDGHTLQMEFASHWKYNTPFNLLFEYPFSEVEL